MNWIQSHLIQLILPLVFMAIMGMLIKALPDILEKRISEALEKLFLMGDPNDDAWLVANIKWAEAKYGAGTGAVKAGAVVSKILSLLPIQYRLFVSDKMRAKAVELFQECFDRVESVALKESEEHKA